MRRHTPAPAPAAAHSSVIDDARARALGQPWRRARIIAALAAFLLAPAVALGQTQSASPAAEESPQQQLPRIELTPELLHQLLIAEIAGGRGDLKLALSTYVDLARSTRDQRIVRRAVELSLYARQPALALEMSELWVEVEAGSAQARQTLAGLLLAAQRPDEAALHVAKLLEQESGHVDEGLLRLNRLFARYPDKQEALRLVEQLTAPYLDHPEAHFARAEAAAGAGDDALALAAIERAQALRPEWQQAVLLKARTQQRTSAPRALETLNHYLASYPNSREVRLAYARMLVGEKQYETARQQFRTVLEAAKDDPEAIYAVALLSLQVNDLAVAEAQFKHLLDVGFGDPNVVRFYLGQIAEQGNRVAEALDWYQAVSSGDQYLPAQMRAAKLAAREGRLEDGRALLRRAGQANPRERVSLLVAESQLLHEAGNTREAFELLAQDLAAAPEQPQLLYETALLAEKLRRFEVMESNLRKLIALQPDHAHAYNALGYSLADRNERLDEALQLIDKALSLLPDDAFVLDSKGWVLYRRGDAGAALDFLSRAYKQRPDPEIAAHLGEVLWVLGRRNEADQTWQAAVQANPDNPALQATMNKFNPQ